MRTCKLPFLLPPPLIAIAVAMFVVVASQRHTAATAAARNEAAVQMLIGMLDQETGLRGFVQTGQASFLAPFHSGREEEAVAVAAARHQADGDRRTEVLLAR